MQSIWKVLLLFSLLGAAMAGMAQEECCPDRARAISIEGWFLHNSTHIGVGYWLNSKTNLSLAIAPGAPLVLAGKVTSVVEQVCIFDLHLLAILRLPLPAVNWQTLGLGASLEFCFPGVPEFAFEIGGGIYLSLPDWTSGMFSLLTVKFYV